MGKRSSAFTLVEVIIVVSILVVLAILSLVFFRGQIFKGNDARRKSDLNRIKVAVEEYEKDHNNYPLSVSCLEPTTLQPYLESIPCEPKSNKPYYYEPETNSSSPSWMRIYTRLENLNDEDVLYNIGPDCYYNFYVGSSNAPVPTAASSGCGTNFVWYGCKEGSCVNIGYNITRTGPECQPVFDNSKCNRQCGTPANPANECVPR